MSGNVLIDAVREMVVFDERIKIELSVVGKEE